MPEFFNTTGKRVRILRQDLGLTQDEMHRRLRAAGTEISRSYISVIERQDLLAGSDLVRGLAKVLNTSTDYLLLMTDDPMPYRGESDEEPLGLDVRALAGRLNQLPDSVRPRMLEIVDRMLQLIRALSEDEDSMRIMGATAEAPGPGALPASEESAADAPYEALVMDYLSRLSEDDMRLAIAKALELLIKQNGKSLSVHESHPASDDK